MNQKVSFKIKIKKKKKKKKMRTMNQISDIRITKQRKSKIKEEEARVFVNTHSKSDLRTRDSGED